MVVNITSGHPASLITTLPSIHYPVPASFELTQRVPTDWVCGATNKPLLEGVYIPMGLQRRRKASQADKEGLQPAVPQLVKGVFVPATAEKRGVWM